MRSAHERGGAADHRPARQVPAASSIDPRQQRNAVLSLPTVDQLDSMALALEHIKQATGFDGIPSQAERRSMAAFPERFGHLVRPWWSEVAA